jgi:hypothetical protein
MSDIHRVYRLISFDTLRFHTHLETRGECDKRKVAYTRGRRKDPFAAGYRVTVFPIKVDPKHPKRLTKEVVEDINRWRDIMSKPKVTIRSRTKEPTLYHMASF